MPNFVIEDFDLISGQSLGKVIIAYRTYGTLSPQRDNAILVTHGLTSSHLAAEPPTLDMRIGWGAGQIGPGRLYDTDRYFVISSNVLGSAYGSTSAASRAPHLGRRWGPDFPLVTMTDVVRAQERLIAGFGITRLKAVAGASLGGFQAYQWAVTFPEKIERVIATDTADHDALDMGGAIPGMLERFEFNAAWNGGDPRPGALEAELAEMRAETLVSYGIRAKIARVTGNTVRQEQLLQDEAIAWARLFDPWVLVSMYRTAASFDVRDQLWRIRAPFLIVMADTDAWFPPAIGRAQEARLRGAGVDLTYHEIESDLGHFATSEEPEKWHAAARRFLDRPY